jgi:HPt (histidine-containing phosphotransfer) domain-containing protein
MRSTNYWPRPSQSAAAAENQFEQLRGAFYTRLCSDRKQLTLMSAELAGAAADATRVYEEIRMLAHKMCGAAAIFDAPEVGGAAYTLEQASLSAIRSHADNSDDGVWTALESLVDVLLTTAQRNMAEMRRASR